MSDRNFKVCYFGTYRSNYSRNVIMIEGLRRVGVEVIECHEPLWHGIEDRVNAVKGQWKHPRFWVRLIRVYARLIKKILTIGQYDVMVVGYPGHLDVFLARIICWFHKKPLVWDIFMSIYLISVERGLEKANPLAVSLLRFIERMGSRLPDLLVIDTADYRDWFCKLHGCSKQKFALVPTGADNQMFFPGAFTNTGKFTVLYYGSYIPNHGLLEVVEAAKRLSSVEHIQFEFIGDGPDKQQVMTLVEKNHLRNISFFDWLPQTELIHRLHSSQVSLGAFGDTPQSHMTVQNKIYEGLAAAKPVITGDGPAVRKAFVHKQHLYICERNAEAIAEAILELYQNPDLCNQIGQAGFEVFQSNYTIEKIGGCFVEHIVRIMDLKKQGLYPK